MPFYEIEILLDSLKELADKEEEQRKKQEGQQNGSAPNLNISSYQRQMNQSMANSSQMPKMPNFKL
jgi:hypothetical protein